MMNEVQEKLNIMRDTVEDNFKKLQYILNLDDDLGKLSRYLLTTERNPYNIFSEGYSQENIECFLSLVQDLNYSIYDDGDITFYTVNDAPRISLEYDFSEDDYLNEFEKTLVKNNKELWKNDPDMKDFKLYECKKLSISIDDWIVLSEEYHKADIKDCFIHDYDGTEWAVEHYKKYKCFEESWIEEAKSKIN